MNFIVEEDKIIVPRAEGFDIKATLECGQLFRYKDNGDFYEVFALDKRAILKNEGINAVIYTDNVNFFVKYFDLYRNYDIIRLKLGDKGLIGAASEYGKGIKILNQNPLETLFSFIISANNHIPRIQSIIQKICNSLGQHMDGYSAFPTVDALASKDANFYFELGAGYRAPYIVQTARHLRGSSFLDEIAVMPTAEARKALCTLKGVGPKVADCVLLFGYHRTDTFPVDTWIKKVYADMFGQSPSANVMSKRLVAEFKELSGYAQQYLFYYKRELN